MWKLFSNLKHVLFTLYYMMHAWLLFSIRIDLLLHPQFLQDDVAIFPSSKWPLFKNAYMMLIFILAKWTDFKLLLFPRKKNHCGLAYSSQWLSYLTSRNQSRFALNENTCKQQHLRHKSVVFHFYWKSSPSNRMKENSFDFYNRIKNQIIK